MLLLATPWYPDLSPIGCSSIGAFLICTLLLLLASPLFNPNRPARAFVAGATPPLMFALISFALTARIRPGPDASEFVAVLVFVMCGLILAADQIRLGKTLRLVGLLWWHLFGSLLFLWTWHMLALGGYTPRISETAFHVVCLLQLPCWSVTGLQFRIVEEAPPGSCAACGYDLTGNVSGRCPECGRSTSDSIDVDPLAGRGPGPYLRRWAFGDGST